MDVYYTQGTPVSDKERRQIRRTPSSVEAELYDPKGRMVIGEGHFLNLSEKGALLTSAKPLRPRQTIRMHLLSAGHTALELMGRVVWARKQRPGFAYGIKFSESLPRKSY